ncbi:30S ribosomal protein S5 [Candidatus Acetothermia bacterium]|jgi:small subunit ribosomal protein S5|nr:30S ribosomal protein S5 [Candidatus Acetothermia bacterium]MCI2431153.1 30S ribosomal protein S5 [Candidatus Acetothermia bacterium]MCI2436043.1 30S ribosomal protein S5 [Candidatus Acetothermia bacterium]
MAKRQSSGAGRGVGAGRSTRARERRAPADGIENEVIDLRRVAKVTKGGKNLSFRATVVVGNGQGRVGIGKGNTREVPSAIQRAIHDARRRLIQIPLIEDRTIPHEVWGKFKASQVLLKPAFPGTGIIAGGTVGAICRLAGIRDILTKARGSTNPLTLARATLDGLKQLRTLEQVAQARNKRPEEALQ